MTIHSRRDVLRLGSVAAATALTGCTDWQFAERPDLTLRFINRYPESVEFFVDLLRADRAEASEALVLNEEYDVSERDDDGKAGIRIVEDIVPSRRYLVRTEVWEADGRTIDRAHYHFLPDCTGGDDPPETLLVELSPKVTVEPAEYFLEFAQSSCSTDAVFL